MKKKTTQTLLLLLSSLLLLISLEASASAQLIPNSDRFRTFTVTGQIRWNKEMGVIPMGPGNSKPAVYPCNQYSVVATDPRSGKAVTYTDQVSSPMQFVDAGGSYVCRYSLRVPGGRNLRIIATMGGILLLPKEDSDPMYTTDAWIGGSRSKPPRRYQRVFTGHTYLTMGRRRPRAVVNFEITYVQVEPN